MHLSALVEYIQKGAESAEIEAYARKLTKGSKTALEAIEQVRDEFYLGASAYHATSDHESRVTHVAIMLLAAGFAIRIVADLQHHDDPEQIRLKVECSVPSAEHDGINLWVNVMLPEPEPRMPVRLEHHLSPPRKTFEATS